MHSAAASWPSFCTGFSGVKKPVCWGLLGCLGVIPSSRTLSPDYAEQGQGTGKSTPIPSGNPCCSSHGGDGIYLLLRGPKKI